MVTRKVKRKPRTDELEDEVGEYLLNRSTRERAEYHEGRYKRQFMDLLAEVGEEQAGGHRVIHLNEPILFHSYKAGKLQEKEITGIQRQRRAGSSLNEERTMAYLKAMGLLERCTKTILTIDEDAILAANFEETISDDDLKKLYDEHESFAFYLVEGEPEGAPEE